MLSFLMPWEEFWGGFPLLKEEGRAYLCASKEEGGKKEKTGISICPLEKRVVWCQIRARSPDNVYSSK